MRIGMIVYSRTGNTHSVALKLQEKLSAAGHEVSLERLKAVGEPRPGAKDVRFETLPDAEPYDVLVLGSSVEGFSLAPGMQSYLAQIGPLPDKQVACLVTEFFPYPWLGGNRAVRQMTQACEAKGAVVCGSGIVNWSRPTRERQIAQVVEQLSEDIGRAGG